MSLFQLNFVVVVVHINGTNSMFFFQTFLIWEKFLCLSKLGRSDNVEFINAAVCVTTLTAMILLGLAGTFTTSSRK